MKISWGTGIVLAFIGFISFIVFFVVRMSNDDRSNHDLVTEDYYSKTLKYQNEIDAEKNTQNADYTIEVNKTIEGLLIIFPKAVNAPINGNISLYRPSNKHLDFEVPINLTDSQLLIPSKRLADGRWDIKISWQEREKEFMYKERITY